MSRVDDAYALISEHVADKETLIAIADTLALAVEMGGNVVVMFNDKNAWIESPEGPAHA